MTPLRLSDEQLAALLRTAQTIPYDRRDAFLRMVADQLRNQDLGDGAVGRAIRSAAWEFFDAPLEVESA